MLCVAGLLPLLWAVGALLFVGATLEVACPFEKVGQGLAGNLTLPSRMMLPVIAVLSPSGACSRLQTVGVLGAALLDMCLALDGYSVAVGDFNLLVALSWECSRSSIGFCPSFLVLFLL